MYPAYVLWLSVRRLPSSNRATPSGCSDPLSRMSEHRPDTDSERPMLVGAWVRGRYYMGEMDGDEGEFVSAERTVPIKHAR